jgi:hypothetical protein
MTTVVDHVDSVRLFDHLAERMSTETERFERLGDVNLRLALVMDREGREAFRLQLAFEGISCPGVTEFGPGEEKMADCWLEGDLSDWQAMFQDIAEHGHATGRWTLNTLTVFGDRIRLHSTDPMGEDRFHRFNQSLQEFFDGAAHLAPAKE